MSSRSDSGRSSPSSSPRSMSPKRRLSPLSPLSPKNLDRQISPRNMDIPPKLSPLIENSSSSSQGKNPSPRSVPGERSEGFSHGQAACSAGKTAASENPDNGAQEELNEIRVALAYLLQKMELHTAKKSSSANLHLTLCLATATTLLRQLGTALGGPHEEPLRDASGSVIGPRLTSSSDLYGRANRGNFEMMSTLRSIESAGGECFTPSDVGELKRAPTNLTLIYDTVLDEASNYESTDNNQIRKLSFVSRDPTVIKRDVSTLAQAHSFWSETAQRPPFFFIHPEKPFRLGWDASCLFMILVVSLMAPFELAFYFEADPPESFAVISGIIDVYFVIDILFNFITGYHEGHGLGGKLISNNKRMALHYLRGFFALDLLATFPYVQVAGLFELTSGSGSGTDAAGLLKIFKYAKIARVMKVLRVLKLGGLMQSVEEKIVAVQSMTVAFQLTKMTTTMLILSHSVACVWFALANLNEGAYTWLDAQGLVFSPISDQYIASFYFTITTGTTVGYGDISPANALEQAVTSFLLVASVAYIGQFLGRVSQIVGSLRETEQLMGKSKRESLLFMIQRGVPKALQFKVLRYIEHTYEIISLTALDGKFFDLLSESLRSELALAVQGDIFRKFPLFADVDTEFLTALCSVGSTKRAGIGDIVVAEEQAAHEMFWVVRGEAAVWRKGVLVNILRQDDWFGELALFFPGAVRSATVRCETNCEFLFLHHDQFRKQIREFPQVRTEFERISQELRNGNPNGLRLRYATCGSKDHTAEECEFLGPELSFD